MKLKKLFEFEDLSPEIQKEVIGKLTNKETEAEDLEKNRITEKEYYDILGCDKHYAETTGWLIPSCYYDNNKEEVDKRIQKEKNDMLYTEDGKIVALKERNVNIDYPPAEIIDYIKEELKELSRTDNKEIRRHSKGLLSTLIK